MRYNDYEHRHGRLHRIAPLLIFSPKSRPLVANSSSPFLQQQQQTMPEDIGTVIAWLDVPLKNLAKGSFNPILGILFSSDN